MGRDEVATKARLTAMRLVALTPLLTATFWMGDSQTSESVAAFFAVLVAYLGVDAWLQGRSGRTLEAQDGALCVEFEGCGDVRCAIEYFRSHELGSEILWSHARALQNFVSRWSDRDHAFRDENIEKARAVLIDRTVEFLRALTESTVSGERDGMYALREGVDRTEALKGLAEGVARSHREFSGKCHRRLG